MSGKYFDMSFLQKEGFSSILEKLKWCLQVCKLEYNKLPDYKKLQNALLHLISHRAVSLLDSPVNIKAHDR